MQGRTTDGALGRRVNLGSFLSSVERRTDLVALARAALCLTPPDLFSVLQCERRLRTYDCDRTVCLTVFLADFFSDLSAHVPDESAMLALRHSAQATLGAAICHYFPDRVEIQDLAIALRSLIKTGLLREAHTSFERTFRNWKQMLKTARRMPDAKVVEHCDKYGHLDRGSLVADSVGNTLSHVRHLYCDCAFANHKFTFEG